MAQAGVVVAKVGLPKPKSIRHEELNGLVWVWGQSGVGKTTAALTFQNPQRTSFFDCDFGKGEGRCKGLGMLGESGAPRRYFDLSAELAALDPGQWWERVFAQIPKRLAPNTDTLILDNLDDFQTAALEWADAHKKELLAPSGQSDKVQAKGGNYPVVNIMIARWLSALRAAGVKLVIVISHIKPRWSGNGPIPGKYNVRGTDTWKLAANVMLALHFVPGHACPAAVVWKDGTGAPVWNEETGEFEVSGSFPKLIMDFTPKKLYGYLDEPADLAHPKEGETPDEEMLAMYGDHFTSTQLAWITPRADEETVVAAAPTTALLKEGERELALIDNNLYDTAPFKAALAKGPVIAPVLSKELSVPVPVVMKILTLLQGK